MKVLTNGRVFFYFVSATMITAGILMIFTAVVSSYLSKRRNQANQDVEDT